MLGEEALTLVLGVERLPMVPAAAKTEGSILQKMSRKQKLTADNLLQFGTEAETGLLRSNLLYCYLSVS